AKCGPLMSHSSRLLSEVITNAPLRVPTRTRTPLICTPPRIPARSRPAWPASIPVRYHSPPILGRLATAKLIAGRGAAYREGGAGGGGGREGGAAGRAWRAGWAA